MDWGWFAFGCLASFCVGCFLGFLICEDDTEATKKGG